ncbi:hypothetical protein L211DRAFT_305252 [Terfezia boudieri ATCC MYA-4762]|uniref:Uncharacterized protein n=1 Tax=Terfezia boudieri ATCC MYA-4762 TaxID=1051890 RepID=A0A3N4LMW3_9PEZI|nr:hypothetical protein L211DRAFT_305252 [Terfezia boudieri ATCC MYA-4762]
MLLRQYSISEPSSSFTNRIFSHPHYAQHSGSQHPCFSQRRYPANQIFPSITAVVRETAQEQRLS